MDDASAITQKETSGLWKEGKSIDCLREAKPSEDISIKNKIRTAISEDENKISKTKMTKNDSHTSKSKTENVEPAKTKGDDKPTLEDEIETVFEKLDITSEKTDSTADSTVSGRENEPSNIKNTSSGIKAQIDLISETKIEIKEKMSKSDELDMERSGNIEVKARASEPKKDLYSSGEVDIRKTTSSIYSVKGTPSGRINRKRDTTSSVFPVGCMGCKEEIPLESKSSPRRFLDANEAATDYVGHINSTPRKRPSSGKQEIDRNPVTGAGVGMTENRRQLIKRKDGNPLLGTGYENTERVVAPSSSRIPPGGYSKGLW